MKKTLVIGASSKPVRVSREAVLKLREAGHEVIAIGAQEDKIGDVSIQTGHPFIMDDLHTVTLYLNPDRQTEYYDYLLALKPTRILFNPLTVKKFKCSFRAGNKKGGINLNLSLKLISY
jgi:predicted CoA-binding protein